MLRLTCPSSPSDTARSQTRRARLWPSPPLAQSADSDLSPRRFPGSLRLSLGRRVDLNSLGTGVDHILPRSAELVLAFSRINRNDFLPAAQQPHLKSVLELQGRRISIRSTVTVMNLREMPQKAPQAFWAQDFTSKLLNLNILVLYFPLTC